MNVSSATSAVSMQDEEIVPSQRGKNFLDSLQKCVNGTKLNDASINLAFPGVRQRLKNLRSAKRNFPLSSSTKNSSTEILNKNLLFDQIREEFDHDVKELLKEGRVMSSLNKLDKIQQEQSKISAEYRKIPKWRPYGFPADDLRPYRIRQMEIFRNDLKTTAERLEAEKKHLSDEICSRRLKIKENEKIYSEKIDEILKIHTNLIDESISSEIVRISS